ncbi:MAG: hypothetical protein D6744_08835 [Planctomycetota bacterium]|nr:MAG: hypothetical protein D6744_08835 [Planctomycetota bacterium]
MTYDLRSILAGWEYEPGKISVRKIVGRDGREKIQTRVDLGVLQFEPDNRPDGVRPFGCESLLEYFELRLREYIARHGSDEGFELSAQACHDLRNEAHLYYQRYLSFFVLEEFDKVERDTERNLRVIDFVSLYGDDGHDCEALESQRVYVMMMNTRARAYREMAMEDFEAALRCVEDGIEELRGQLEESHYVDDFADIDEAPEIRVLESLRNEIYDKMPPTCPERLKRDLEDAIACEDYERAAQIRDQLQSR